MKKINIKYIVAIIISLIIGISILGYGYMNYRYKIKVIESENQSKAEEIKREEEKESTKKRNLNLCNLAAENDYTDYWNAQCKVQGRDKKTDDCSLPKYIADDVEARRQKSLDNCIKLYGN